MTRRSFWRTSLRATSIPIIHGEPLIFYEALCRKSKRHCFLSRITLISQTRVTGFMRCRTGESSKHFSTIKVQTLEPIGPEDWVGDKPTSANTADQTDQAAIT